MYTRNFGELRVGQIAVGPARTGCHRWPEGRFNGALGGREAGRGVEVVVNPARIGRDARASSMTCAQGRVSGSDASELGGGSSCWPEGLAGCRRVCRTVRMSCPEPVCSGGGGGCGWGRGGCHGGHRVAEFAEVPEA